MVKYGKTARSEKEKAEKKEKILKAALRVFMEKGYHRTTMSDVAEEARTGRGTVYWHFDSKEKLFLTMFEAELAEIDAIFEKTIMGNFNPLDKIGMFIELSTEFYFRAEDFCMVMLNIFGEKTAGIQGEIYSKIKEAYADYHRIIKGLLDEGIKNGSIRAIDSGQAASILIGMIDGMMIEGGMKLTPLDKKNIAGIMKDIFLRGIENPRNEPAAERHNGER